VSDAARTGGDHWQLSGPYAGCLVAGAVLLAMGGLGRRPDIAVLGVPLLAMVAWSWLRRPVAEPAAEIAPCAQVPGSGRLSAEVQVSSGKPTGRAVGLVGFRVGAPGHRPVECLVVGRPATYEVTMRTVRTGRRVLEMTSPAVSNSIAALLLHLRDTYGIRPNVYFEWTEGNPVSNLLRTRYKYSFNDAGFDRAVQEAAKIRSSADSARSASQPSTAVPLGLQPPAGSSTPAASSTPGGRR